MLAILESPTFWTAVSAVAVSFLSIGGGLVLGRWKRSAENHDAFRSDFSTLIKEFREERVSLKIELESLRSQILTCTVRNRQQSDRIDLLEKTLLRAGIDVPAVLNFGT